MPRQERLATSSADAEPSPQPIARGEAIDPDNRLLWHFSVRRLEAETIRDCLLAASGRLDPTVGGSLLHVKNREWLFDHTSKDATNYDSTRRSVYLPVIRNNLYDVFQLFDATDATVPSGDRASSTVATQALFLMNGPLVLECAESLARDTLGEAGRDEQRVERLYKRLYARPATSREIARALAFVSSCRTGPVERADGADVQLESWTALCHVLMTSNEFLYVR